MSQFFIQIRARVGTNKMEEKEKIIILMIDDNEDLNRDKLERSLAHLVMQDLFKEMTGKREEATHSRGTNQIYGIWSTKDIDCHTAIFLPLWSVI